MSDSERKEEEVADNASDNDSSQGEGERDPQSSPKKEKSKKSKKEKKSKKSKKSKKENNSDDESEQGESGDDRQKEKKKKSSKRSSVSKGNTESDEFNSVYEGLEDEPWELYDAPTGCVTMSTLHTTLSGKQINDFALFERDDKYYRWARLGEKGNQQMLIGPLYFLSMGDYETSSYAETYFYCATPKDHFHSIERTLNKKLIGAEQKFKSNGHGALQKKEIKYRLPALERFRMGLIDAGETDEDKMEAKECTLVQFPLSIADSGKFTAVCGEEDVVLGDVLDRMPGLIGYANVTVSFSTEVLPYAEVESDASDDDEKNSKGSSAKRKKKKKKSKKQDPMDPSAHCGKVNVKFKVSCISIVAQTVVKGVPMNDSRSMDVIKPSSALLSVIKKKM